MSFQVLSDGGEPRRISKARFFQVSITLSGGAGLLVGAIVALFLFPPMLHDASVAQASSLVALHASEYSLGEQTATTLGKGSIRQKELALLSSNHAIASNHERNGMRDAYGLRTRGDPAASTQLYESRRPGTQQFGDQAYPFQEKIFTTDRKNYPYAFGTNQFRESEHFAGTGNRVQTGLRDPYDLRTKGDAAATTQLYEGMRPGTQQFGDQAYPFQQERFMKNREHHPYAFGTNQFQESATSARARSHEWNGVRGAYAMRTKEGPVETAHVYKGERPEIEQFRDQPSASQEKNDQLSTRDRENHGLRQAYGLRTTEVSAASNQERDNYERELVEPEGGPMQDESGEDWEDWDTWQRQSESFAARQ